MLRHACRLSLEGVVSKRATPPTAPAAAGTGSSRNAPTGRSSSSPATCPPRRRQDLVGSLVLGYHTRRQARACRPRRHRLQPRGGARPASPGSSRCARKTSPFAAKLDAPTRRAASSGSSPTLVAEVEFRAWTADGILRHASFRGLREDKPAREIVREAAAEAARRRPAAAGPADPSRPRLLAGRRRHQAGPRRLLRRGLAAHGAPRRRPAAGAAALPGRHRGPVLLPEARLEGPQPRDPDLPRSARGRATTRSSPIDGLPGLIGLVQGGALEIHPWQSTLDDLEQPDQIVMDLDPGEGVSWTAVIDAAREVRARLEDAGLAGLRQDLRRQGPARRRAR